MSVMAIFQQLPNQKRSPRDPPKFPLAPDSPAFRLSAEQIENRE